jgi:hypothetical protein
MVAACKKMLVEGMGFLFLEDLDSFAITEDITNITRKLIFSGL